jgi:hypothetical protein
MHIQKNTDRRRYGTRGSAAVEAAIMLPLFIIGILTIGYLLKFCMVSDGVHHALTDEAHRIMAEAPVMPYPIGSEQEIVTRVESESRGEADSVKTGRFLYSAFGVSKGGKVYTDLTAISVSFETPLKLPKIFLSEVKGERTVLCRAFVGMAQSGNAKPFSEMEQDDDGTTVWVFPRSGERYHDEHCAYIENNPREVLLDKYVRSRYSPCKLCRPDGSRDGTLVYCFITSGRAYHTGSCTTVDRYVIEIGKEDAEKQGYTACSKCGGGS